jgi:hypothetical protein
MQNKSSEHPGFPPVTGSRSGDPIAPPIFVFEVVGLEGGDDAGFTAGVARERQDLVHIACSCGVRRRSASLSGAKVA